LDRGAKTGGEAFLTDHSVALLASELAPDEEALARI
jgi:hypothetical protein